MMTPSSVSAVTSRHAGQASRGRRTASDSGRPGTLSGRPSKTPYAVMLDERRLAVHRVVEHAQLAAERLDDALQAEADAEHRDAAAARRAGPGRARRNRRGGPGRARSESGRGDFVDQLQREAGAIGDHFRAGLPRVVGERVDEAVVVVDQQQFGRRRRGQFGARRLPSASSGRPRARKKPVALRRVSCSSSGGHGIVEQRRARRIAARCRRAGGPCGSGCRY